CLTPGTNGPSEDGSITSLILCLSSGPITASMPTTGASAQIPPRPNCLSRSLRSSPYILLIGSTNSLPPIILRDTSSTTPRNTTILQTTISQSSTPASTASESSILRSSASSTSGISALRMRGWTTTIISGIPASPPTWYQGESSSLKNNAGL